MIIRLSGSIERVNMTNSLVFYDPATEETSAALAWDRDTPLTRMVIDMAYDMAESALLSKLQPSTFEGMSRAGVHGLFSIMVTQLSIEAVRHLGVLAEDSISPFWILPLPTKNHIRIPIK